MLRRLHPDQPESFAFTPANQAWAEAQISKYPPGRQASAVIPLLWRAQEQEGWLTRPAIEHVAAMLDMPKIRVLEVATFYFMFQLQPVGSVAHIQVCGTTSCMICGAEDLIGVCRERIAPNPHELSADGKFSWEEVECLGACANAPMAQIGKDYYEDLTAERLAWILDELAAGRVPVPGPQAGRYASEPAAGPTTLTAFEKGRASHNASVELATALGDTVKRIDGTEVPLRTPWLTFGAGHEPAPYRPPEAASTAPAEAAVSGAEAAPSRSVPSPEVAAAKEAAATKDAAGKDTAEREGATRAADATGAGRRPELLEAPREGGPDDLKQIKGVGPKLEQMLHGMGIFHFDQIAAWGPEEVAWVDENLQGFKGRVSRDNWVEQARRLAAGEETEFSSRVKKGDVY